MPKRNEKTVAESRAPQRLGTLQTPKIEIDFDSLIAAGIAAVVIKPANLPYWSVQPYRLWP
jgi:hypothetical protein